MLKNITFLAEWKDVMILFVKADVEKWKSSKHKNLEEYLVLLFLCSSTMCIGYYYCLPNMTKRNL